MGIIKWFLLLIIGIKMKPGWSKPYIHKILNPKEKD